MFCTLVLLGALAMPQAPQGVVAQAREAVVASEVSHGADSLEAAEKLLKLFTALTQAGQHPEALEVAKRTLAIREAKLPAGHQRIGIARVNVASALLALDEPAQARPYLEQARELLAKGPTSRALLGTLVNLGACHYKLGNYGEATRLLEEAVAYARQNSPDHPFFAGALQSLAVLRLHYDDVEAARKLIEEAIAVSERTDPGGERHAHALFVLGVAMMYAERLDDAEPLLVRAREMRVRLFGAASAQVGDTDVYLAGLRHDRGDLAGARQGFELAIGTAEACGDRPGAAYRHCHLARVLLLLGELEAAAAHMQDAMAGARSLGLPARSTYTIQFGQAELLEATGDLPAAAAVLREVLALAQEEPLVAFKARSHLARALRASGDAAGAVRLAGENLARFAELMARVLPAMFEQGRLAYVAEYRRDLDLLLACTAIDPALASAADVYREVLAWKGQVARGVQRQLAAAHRDPDDTARVRRLQQIAGEIAMGRAGEPLLRERERLLAALADHAPPAEPPVDVANLRAALGRDEVLLDYVLYRDGTKAPHYAAFVVRADGVQRIDVGPAADVARAVDSFVLLASRSTAAGAAKLGRAVAAAARERVFEPVRSALGSSTKLWISPDDALALLPFEALPGATEGSFLVEQLEIRYLQNAASLLQPPPAIGQPAMLAFGEIEYGTAAATVAARRGVPRPFPPLPAAAQELTAIAAARGDAPCTIVRRAEASETRLRELAGQATWLHFATHGFCGHATGKGAIEAGIALAGANHASGADDGILTADEAALLDLSRCRLVVLSACQTGLGQPFAGESLLGLRRSLHIAGAQATITSLWKVDDAATAALMTDFYRALFGASRSPAAALREAQLQALARHRKAAGEGLPGLWGAFVCEGRS